MVKIIINSGLDRTTNSLFAIFKVDLWPARLELLKTNKEIKAMLSITKTVVALMNFQGHEWQGVQQGVNSLECIIRCISDVEG